MQEPEGKSIQNLLRSQITPIMFLICVGLILRFALYQYTSSDLELFLVDWLNYYKEVPLQEALLYPISNYTGPYNYFLYSGSLIQGILFNMFKIALSDIAIIKLINLPFEGLAIFSGLIIVHHYRPEPRQLFLALTLILFYPILILNSAFWGQCDIIYTSFLILSFAFIIRKQSIWAMVAFGVALTFKFQAMFFAPFLLALLFQKRIRWFHFGILPLVYFLLHTPSLIAGRPFFDVLSIYLNQAQSMPVLTANAANIYQFFSTPTEFQIRTYQIVGVVITFLVGVVYAIRITKREIILTQYGDLMAASLSVMIMPYLLPSMLDRYFFSAELFLLLLAIVDNRYWFLSVFVWLASLGAYTNSYLFQTMPLNAWPVKIGALLNLFVIFVLVKNMMLDEKSPLN